VTGVRLRSATVADLPAITRIWRQGWADGHAGQVPDALTAQRTPASFDQRATERISRTWVAESDGAFVPRMRWQDQLREGDGLVGARNPR
jgi:hypothetical protein